MRKNFPLTTGREKAAGVAGVLMRRIQGRETPLIDLHGQMMLVQDGPFKLGQLGQVLVVIGQGPDFRGTGGGQIALQLEDDERGAGADLQLPLFGLEGLVGVIAASLVALVCSKSLLAFSMVFWI